MQKVHRRKETKEKPINWSYALGRRRSIETVKYEKHLHTNYHRSYQVVAGIGSFVVGKSNRAHKRSPTHAHHWIEVFISLICSWSDSLSIQRLIFWLLLLSLPTTPPPPPLVLQSDTLTNLQNTFFFVIIIVVYSQPLPHPLHHSTCKTKEFKTDWKKKKRKNNHCANHMWAIHKLQLQTKVKYRIQLEIHAKKTDSRRSRRKEEEDKSKAFGPKKRKIHRHRDTSTHTYTRARTAFIFSAGGSVG